MTESAPLHEQPARYAPHPQHQQHGAPAYGSAYAQPASYQQSQDPERRRRAFAVTGAVIAGVLVLLGFVQSIAFGMAVSSGGGPTALGAIGFVSGIVVAVLALAAIVAAFIALVRREHARVLVGIALGIGASSLLGLLNGLVQTAAMAAF